MRIVAALMMVACGAGEPAFAADAPAAAHRPAPSADLRLIVAVAAPAPDPLDDLRRRTRRRPASPMIDFYPVGGTGFRLSVGSRLHRRVLGTQGDRAARGLLYGPRSGGAPVARWNASRFAPVATLGYAQALGAGVSLGVEGGARLGPAFGGLPRTPRLDGTRGEGPSALVNVVLGYGF